ncbi:hypothetical protein [Dysgonomonas sp. 520]|uniref:hypothetical protein n=1 Tax=Dysgonomonas sp. 520 TaxID=2302931 RepID=UPI0013D2B9F1|nr:hypothetical protein [Dysgonomonas sp. 520]NDW11157.1 hypothetical protein [Dysgonomonas sp. 520]
MDSKLTVKIEISDTWHNARNKDGIFEKIDIETINNTNVEIIIDEQIEVIIDDKDIYPPIFINKRLLGLNTIPVGSTTIPEDKNIFRILKHRNCHLEKFHLVFRFGDNIENSNTINITNKQV